MVRNGKERGHPHHHRPQNFIADVEVVMGEAAALVGEDAVVRVLGGVFRHGDAEGRPLLHALEDEVDAVGVVLRHAAQPRQDMVLLAHALLGPLDRKPMIAGEGLDPVLVVGGAPAQDLLADHRDADHLAEEVHHLLGPRQAAEITVNDNAVEAVIDKHQKFAEQLGEYFHGKPRTARSGPKPIKRGPGQRMVDGKRFRLADEVRYILRRAADHDGRVVTIGQLMLFSSETGDAWLLDRDDHSPLGSPATGDPEPFHIEETDTTFAIDWKGRYRIERPAFVYTDRDTGRHHHPRLPDRQAHPGSMTGKFQICLARFRSIKGDRPCNPNSTSRISPTRKPGSLTSKAVCGQMDRSARIAERSVRQPVRGGRATRPGLWNCRACRKPFTVKIKTVFESSHVPLHIWLQTIHLFCSSKKGFATRQLQRTLGCSMKTAWSLGMRVREAMRDLGIADAPLGGANQVVEADETFVGGKAANRKGKIPPKAIMLSLVERGGKVRSFRIPNVTAQTLRPIIVANVDKASYLMTDDSPVYPGIGAAFAGHGSVNHSAEEYVRAYFWHTNSVEGYFSIFKRAVFGCFPCIRMASAPLCRRA